MGSLNPKLIRTEAWSDSPIWEVNTGISMSLEELNKLPWQNGTNNLEVTTKRQIIDLKEIPETNKTPSIGLLEQLTSKETIINELQVLFDQNSDMFYKHYPFDTRKYGTFSGYLDKQLHITSYLVKDTTEYELANHVDNKFTFGNIIINLVENKDTTSFYRDVDSKEPCYTSTQEQGKGVLFINTERTVHNIKVYQTEPRYILMVKLLLVNLL